MTPKQEQIINAFNAYIGAPSALYSEWYVGVAVDPRDRLFNGHAIREQTDAWIHDTCSSSREAREIEQYFIGRGMRGGPGGGDATTRSVYAYKVARHTIE
jgi:hypothetical protein